MNKSNRPKYSWDSSVFLAWISKDESYPLDDIELVADEIDANRAELIVSTLVYAEILEAKHNKRQMRQFEQFLKRSNVLVADMTVALARMAGDIRGRGLKEKVKRKLKSPDASIIATAIIYGADVLHSFDPHILNLNGSTTVNGLKISLPRLITGQKALPGIISPKEAD